MEIWKGIYAGYQISNKGRVRSLKSSRLLVQREHKKGYLQVHLRVDGEDVMPKVHRLVAMAFIPNPYNLPQVNHIDGNKQNNRVENLEWCTNSQNQEHSYRVLLRIPSQKPVVCVENNEVYHSAREASKRCGVDSSSITKCCKGTRQTTGGLHWRYAD